MGNETSTEEGAQFESSDRVEVQGDINDLLGFLSLDQIESPRAENEEENPEIKIPPEPGGKEEDAHSDEGSVPKNIETSDTDTTSRDAALNESDDSDDTKFSEERSSPLPVSSVSVSPVSVSPVPVSPVPEGKEGSITIPNGEEEEQTFRKEDDAVENEEESNNDAPTLSKIDTSDEIIISQALTQGEDDPVRNDVENDESSSGTLHTPASAETETANKSISEEVPAQIVEEDDSPENNAEHDEENNNDALQSLPLTDSETADNSALSSTQIEVLGENDQKNTQALTEEANESIALRPSEEVARKDENSSENDEKIDKKSNKDAVHFQALGKVETVNESISLDGGRQQMAEDNRNNLGNEQHNKRDCVNTSATVAASESLDKLILLKAPGQISRKEKIPTRNEVGDSNTPGDDATIAKATKPKPSPEKRVSRRGSQVFSEGSLKGTLEKINENSICRDPLLKAVAAGSAVRKAKRQEKMRSARVFSSNNEWKISLRRLARTAASTAKTVASATAPVISDASRVILSSATEFAQDFKDELEKEYKRPPEAEPKKNPATDDDKRKELEEKAESKSDEDQDIDDERKTDSVPGGDDDSKTEIIMNIMTDEEKNNENKIDDSKDTDDVSGFFDALEGIGLSFETENSASQVNSQRQDSFRQLDSFDTDNGSSSPEKCIFDELKDIEENFDAQIKTMLGGDSFTMEDNNDSTDHDFSERTDIDFSERTDNEFSERSTESSFLGRSNFFVEPIITETLSEEKSSESNVRNETNFVEEITPRIRNHLDLHEDENNKPEDPGFIAPVTPQVRTRSGRVVRPVRRLVDGYGTSAWEENRYGSSDKEISIAEEEIVSNGESGSPNNNKANESQFEASEEEPRIEEPEDVAVKDESNKSSTDIDKPDESHFEPTEEEPRIEEPEDIAVKDESNKSSTDIDKPDESQFEPTEEESKIVETEEVDKKDENRKSFMGLGWGWGWGNGSHPETMEEESKIVETKEVAVKDESNHSIEEKESQLHAAEQESKVAETNEVDEKGESKYSSEAIESQLHAVEQESKIVETKEVAVKDESNHSIEEKESQLHAAEQESKVAETNEVDEKDESKDSSEAIESQLHAVEQASKIAERKEAAMKDESNHSIEENESQLDAAEEEFKIQNTEAVALGDDKSKDSAGAKVSQLEVVQDNPKKEQKETMTLDRKIEHSTNANKAPIGNESSGTSKLDKEEPMVDQQIKKDLSDVTKIKVSHLFDTNEDLIFESQDAGTYDEEDNQRAKESEKNLSGLHPEKKSFMHEESLLKDGKMIVEYVVTKLTGYNIKVTDRIDKSDLYDAALMNDRPIPESVFGKQARDDVEVLSSSSFSTPPEIDILSQCEEKDPQDVEKEEMNEFLPIFDFIPAKSEILQSEDTSSGDNKGKPNDPKEYMKKRKLFKVSSSRSIKDSVASFSTHEKSSNNSFVFSPSSRRSRRRLQRQGSKMSLSLTNTQSTKSPFETPIDNRSLAGSGKQRIELTSIDYGGEMVGWDTDVEAKFPSVPDTEEMTEALERSELFHDTLASFSSLENIDFLKNFPLRKSSDAPKSLALLMWRQLLANWKHSEACKAMSNRTSSIQLARSTRHAEIYDFDDSLSSSFSTVRFRLNARELVLPKSFIPRDSYPSLRCSDDDNDYDIMNDGITFLTRYLCNVGPRLSSSVGGCETASGESLLRHDFASAIGDDEKSSALNITEIQKEAKKLLPTFEMVIDHIAKFSTQNSSPYFDLEGGDITFSCGVKDYASIRNKAKRKYKGDVSLVKDVLRGQITFPDEGSLICGLCSLYCIAKEGFSGKEIEGSQPSVPFQIVRLKNLFRTAGVNDEVSNGLPTGYRHVLINIKFDCGIIAGKNY